MRSCGIVKKIPYAELSFVKKEDATVTEFQYGVYLSLLQGPSLCPKLFDWLSTSPCLGESPDENALTLCD